jgi:hypothetical protein
MRKFLTVVTFSLLVIASNAGVLRAQSGRNRSVPTTENSGDAAKPPAGGQKSGGSR